MIVRIPRNILWAVGSKLIEPIDHLSIAATVIDQAAQGIAASAPALFASDVQHIELADEIAEYDCAVRAMHQYDKLGLLWYPLAILADERTDAGAFRQAFSIQNTVRERLTGHTVRERLTGHYEKHEGPNCDEVVSAFHLNASRVAHRPLH